MPKITFLLGLAGSGKTYKANEICESTGAKFFEGIAGKDSQFLLKEMIGHLRAGGSCVVEEIAFCIAENRSRIVDFFIAQLPNIDIEWICFENDLESANWNVCNRLNKSAISGHIGINQQYHPIYTYPDNAPIVPIVRVPEQLRA